MNDKIITDDRFWDCECLQNFVHAKSLEIQCGFCGAVHSNQPDSRQDEILNGLFEQSEILFSSDMTWAIAIELYKHYREDGTLDNQ